MSNINQIHVRLAFLVRCEDNFVSRRRELGMRMRALRDHGRGMFEQSFEFALVAITMHQRNIIITALVTHELSLVCGRLGMARGPVEAPFEFGLARAGEHAEGVVPDRGQALAVSVKMIVCRLKGCTVITRALAVRAPEFMRA